MVTKLDPEPGDPLSRLEPVDPLSRLEPVDPLPRLEPAVSPCQFGGYFLFVFRIYIFIILLFLIGCSI